MDIIREYITEIVTFILRAKVLYIDRSDVVYEQYCKRFFMKILYFLYNVHVKGT